MSMSKTIEKGPSVGFGAIRRGMGADHKDVRRFIGRMQDGLRQPSYNMPVVETVRIHFGGPLTDQAVGGFFGNIIDPLGTSVGSPPAGALSVESTMVEPGKTQSFYLVCAIGWWLQPEPEEFTAPVNAFTASQSTQAKPVSPDFFTENDLNNNSGGFNSMGMTTGQTMVPGDLEWGWWAAQAFYYMSNGYNLEWQYGNRNFLLRDSLRNTAYIPSNAQSGSASNSEADLEWYIRRTNDYYRNNLNPNLIALAIDRARVGSVTSSGGTGSQNIGVYRPTRAYERTGVTYGGMGLRANLRGNSEYRKLSSPRLIWPGVPIGLRAAVSNDEDQALMQQYLSATNGLGGTIPAQFSNDRNINAGGGAGFTGTGSIAGTAAFTGVELTLDPGGAIQIAQQVPSSRVEFKGGAFKVSVAMRGYEVDEATKDALQDPAISDIINSECGCVLSTSISG